MIQRRQFRRLAPFWHSIWAETCGSVATPVLTTSSVTSQKLPILSKYIGQTPRLEKHPWAGDISLWFGEEKVWDTQGEKAEDGFCLGISSKEGLF